MTAALALDHPAPRGGLRISALRVRVAHDAARAPPPMPDAAALAAAIADTVALRLDLGDSSLWVIRRLKLAGRAERPEPAAIAAAVAAALRRQLIRVLAGEVVDGVMRYPSSTHWLADLVAAHARGDATGDWRYAAHSALDPLPFALLPRALFASESGQARAVFARLAADGRLPIVVNALGPRGCAATLPLLLAPAGMVAPDEAAAQVLAQGLATAPPRLAAVPDVATFWAVARHCHEAPNVPPPHRATLDRALALVAEPGLTLVEPDRPQARRGTAAARTKLPFEKRVGAERTVEPDKTKILRSSRAIETSFVGIFLLWRSVRALDLDDLLPNPAAQLALAATLAGPDRDVAWRDPALHWLTGHEPAPEETPPAPPNELETAFFRHLLQRRTPRIVHGARLHSGALTILADAETEDWLAIGPGSRMIRHAAVPVAPPSFRDPARDIAFFGLTRSRARRPWALLARAAYADCARRLTGLERSSAAWLWPNVVAGWGRVTPGRRAQILLPRVPFDMLLRMTGLAGTSYALSDGRHVELLLPGAE